MQSLLELLQEQIRDLVDAEIQYRSKLPEMVDRATDRELKTELTMISHDAAEAISRLREVCEELQTPPEGITCQAMKGLIRETNETVREHGDSATIDANLIANAQRIVHYEIAGFGTAKAFAKCLGFHRSAAILGDLATTAGGHDRALTRIATGGWFGAGINDEAAQKAA